MGEQLTTSPITVAEVRKTRSIWAELFIRLVKEKPLGTVGGVIIIVLVLTGIFANLLAPYGFNEIILADRLDPPSAAHVLGCDNLGRDLLSRIIYGARISMLVGLCGALLEMVVGLLIGVTSGFFGGRFDMAMQRFVDSFMCFPPLVLYLTIMAILGPGLLQVILVLGVSGGIRSSRVSRSAVIGIKENVYFEAARAIGVPGGRTLMRHVIPNIMPVIIIGFSTVIGRMILSEATLSFLGFGIPPPTPSWGGMLSGTGRQYMLQAPWMCLWPGLALAVVVYGVNMLGDAVRDILDPRLRGGLGRYGGAKQKKMQEKMSQDQNQGE